MANTQQINNIPRSIKARVVCKYGSKEDWALAEEVFIPLRGEPIYYSNGSSLGKLAYKVGDGKTLLKNLPLIAAGTDLAGFDVVNQNNSITTSKNTAAFGEKNIAGQKGFRINLDIGATIPSEWISGSYYEVTYDATKVTAEEFKAELEKLVGCKYSIRLTEHRYNYGTIQSVNVENNYIKVDNMYVTTEAIANTPYIWALEQPKVGVEDLGEYAFSTGYLSKTQGFCANSMGYDNKSYGWYSFTAGTGNIAYYGAAALGEDNKSLGTSSFSAGDSNTAENYADTVFGARNYVNGPGALAAGVDLVVRGRAAVAFGTTSSNGAYFKWSQDETQTEFLTKSSGAILAAEHTTLVYNSDAVSTNVDLITYSKTGEFAAIVAEGGFITGKDNLVIGEFSNAHGYANVVKGGRCSAFGKRNIVSNECGFASGQLNMVDGECAHAFGTGNHVSAANSIALGKFNDVTNTASFAMGKYCKVGHMLSSALGHGLTSTSDFQVVVGAWNNTNLSIKNAKFIVGVGTTDSNRKNGLVVGENGDVFAYQSIKLLKKQESDAGDYHIGIYTGDNDSGDSSLGSTIGKIHVKGKIHATKLSGDRIEENGKLLENKYVQQTKEKYHESGSWGNTEETKFTFTLKGKNEAPDIEITLPIDAILDYIKTNLPEWTGGSY